MPAPSQISIRLVIQSPYKGGTREWGNRYFFNSTVAMTTAVFEALADWLVTGEIKDVITTASTIIEAVGYDAGSDVPTHSKTYTQAGTAAPTTGEAIAPLEVVTLWRFTTTQRTTKNHPVYLFKYMHNQIISRSTNPELVVSGRRTFQTAVCADLIAGHTTGGTTYKLAGPHGAVAQTGACEQYFTHRDFPT